MVYVEMFRNIPPLLVIFFWYLGVLALLPVVRDSLGLPFGSFLNSRGFYFPRFVWETASWLVARRPGRRHRLELLRGATAPERAKWRPASSFRCSGRALR